MWGCFPLTFFLTFSIHNPFLEREIDGLKPAVSGLLNLLKKNGLFNFLPWSWSPRKRRRAFTFPHSSSPGAAMQSKECCTRSIPTRNMHARCLEKRLWFNAPSSSFEYKCIEQSLPLYSGRCFGDKDKSQPCLSLGLLRWSHDRYECHGHAWSRRLEQSFATTSPTL